ncbi:hypothetical protein ACN27F_17830 [Solwaraspora sp. WMMB335]|uniref:WXG100 family type VII secretion target n=1 Tax=Solwaraspora sp. WMMB335 TaxID=3404118 RepID=UPI003B959142
MSDNYYGWQPISIPVSIPGNDYVTYDPSDPNQQYTPTDWVYPQTNIEKMWGWIQNESDERVLAVAEMWRRIGVLLETTRTNLQRYADGLAAKWQSPAGEYFLRRVGATLYSLDEWRDAADSNYRGLEQLAGKIESTQESFRTLRERYLAEVENPGSRDPDGLQAVDVIDWVPGITGNNGTKTRDDIMREFHQEAVDTLKPLADMYIDVYISHITRGSTFKGPTDAVPSNTDGVVPIGAGAPPAPPPPGAPPGAPPGLPPRPGVPGLDGPPTPAPPARPDGAGQPAPPPPVPDGLSLAGGTATAPPPAAPPATSTPSGGAGPAPAPPPSVVAPGRSPAGPRPGSPGVNRPGSPFAPGTNRPNPATRPAGPPRPALPGAGAPPPANTPAKRSPAPKRPTLPGSVGPGGSGPRPPAGGARPTPRGTPPAAPQLPGSTGSRAGRPAGTGPQRPAGPPPRLGGPAGATGRRPATGTPRPTGPTAPGNSGKVAPTGPQLPGRSAPAQRGAAPATGPGPTIGGRRGPGPAPAAPRPARKAEDQADNWEYGNGDDELWEVGPAPAGTIEAPPEQRPQEHGRTLGNQQ